MAVLSDFQIVTTGGNFKSSAGFSKKFQTGGRSKGGFLGYFLVDWMSFPEDWNKPATVKFYVNGHWMGTFPVTKKQVVSTIRYSEDNLYATKDNTFKVLSTNAWGGFANVICHFHQGQ